MELQQRRTFIKNAIGVAAGTTVFGTVVSAASSRRELKITTSDGSAKYKLVVTGHDVETDASTSEKDEGRALTVIEGKVESGGLLPWDNADPDVVTIPQEKYIYKFTSRDGNNVRLEDENNQGQKDDVDGQFQIQKGDGAYIVDSTNGISPGPEDDIEVHRTCHSRGTECIELTEYSTGNSCHGSITGESDKEDTWNIVGQATMININHGELSSDNAPRYKRTDIE